MKRQSGVLAFKYVNCFCTIMFLSAINTGPCAISRMQLQFSHLFPMWSISTIWCAPANYNWIRPRHNTQVMWLSSSQQIKQVSSYRRHCSRSWQTAVTVQWHSQMLNCVIVSKQCVDFLIASLAAGSVMIVWRNKQPELWWVSGG